MNEMQTLNYNVVTTKEVRMVIRDGDPWWVAADVCAVLEISNPTMALERLDEDEKAKLNLGLQGGATNVVNEFGLYNLILGSRKPEAKAFKRWVTHEVLPQIRATGSYHGTGGDTPRPTAIAAKKGGLLYAGTVRSVESLLEPPEDGVAVVSGAELMKGVFLHYQKNHGSTGYANKLIRKRAIQAADEGLTVNHYFAIGKERRGNNTLGNAYYATELGCEYIREHMRDGAQRDEFEAFCNSWFRSHR